jgi:hypothetical protein
MLKKDRGWIFLDWAVEHNSLRHILDLLLSVITVSINSGYCGAVARIEN